MRFSEGVDALANRVTGIHVERDPVTHRVVTERFKGSIGGYIFSDDVVNAMQDQFDRIFRSENGDDFIFALLEGKAWGEVVGEGRKREVVLHYINDLADLTVARARLKDILATRMARERPFDPI